MTKMKTTSIGSHIGFFLHEQYPTFFWFAWFKQRGFLADFLSGTAGSLRSELAFLGHVIDQLFNPGSSDFSWRDVGAPKVNGFAWGYFPNPVYYVGSGAHLVPKTHSETKPTFCHSFKEVSSNYLFVSAWI